MTTLVKSDNLRRLPIARNLRIAGEAVLLFLVAFSPWPFASADPFWEYVATCGIGLLVMLWAAYIIAVRQFSLRPDAVSISLAGLMFLSAFQMVPLPEPVVGAISPKSLEWYRTFRPERDERLPGEAASIARPASLSLSADRYLTRTFLGRIIAVALVYLVVRNWLASREALRRLAWVVAANGVLLAAIAIAQFTSSPNNVIFWRTPTDGAVFGPFVCKNHYPDYATIALGMGGALLMLGRRSAVTGRFVWNSETICIALGLVMIAGSIPLSLSRGGLMAAVFAACATAYLIYRYRKNQRSSGLLLVGMLALGATIVVSWFSSTLVEARLKTVLSGQAFDGRWPLWKDAATLVPSFLITGTGNGTFGRVELLARTQSFTNVYFDNAHNEYLEAILEGGLPRLALTLAIAVAVLVASVRGYRKLQLRSSGPLILGGFFGLLALILHSVVDFGIHIPAIAILAATVAAHLCAAATDNGYLPQAEGETPTSDPFRLEIRGLLAIPLALAIVIVPAFLMLDARSRSRVNDYREIGASLAAGTESEIAYRKAAAKIAPANADVQMELAQAHFDAARLQGRAAHAAIAGPAVVISLPNDALSPSGSHIVEGLKAARAARAACWLAPQPHARFGLYVKQYLDGEPALVHWQRARRILPIDPFIGYACGVAQKASGDESAAWVSWRDAIARSPKLVRPILVAAGPVPTERLLRDLIPADANAIQLAVDMLYPARTASIEQRRPFLQTIIALAQRDESALGHVATAFLELNQPEQAIAAWERALVRTPNDVVIRNTFARYLESEERYEDAIPHIEYLLAKSPGLASLHDRVDAAKHAVKLQREIRQNRE